MEDQYKLGTVSQLTGVHPSTLRAWENRYDAFAPLRTASGHRYYTKDHLERIRLIKYLTTAGFGISQISKHSTSKLKKLVEADQGTHRQNMVSPRIAQTKIQNAIDDLLGHVDSFNSQGIHNILAWHSVSIDKRSFVLDFVSPLLRRVGEAVVKGELSVAKEHVLSSLLRHHLGHVINELSAVPHPNQNKNLFVLTTPEKNHHEFGILLAEILLRYHGQNVFSLGPNLPADDLAAASSELKATTLVIGTTPRDPNETRLWLGDYLKTLVPQLSKRVSEIWIGGEGALDLDVNTGNLKIRQVLSLVELDEMVGDKP